MEPSPVHINYCGIRHCEISCEEDLALLSVSRVPYNHLDVSFQSLAVNISGIARSVIKIVVQYPEDIHVKIIVIHPSSIFLWSSLLASLFSFIDIHEGVVIAEATDEMKTKLLKPVYNILLGEICI